MKIAVSNIAWKTHEDDEIATLLRDLGVQGIELAPTRITADPTTLDHHAIEAHRKLWSERGFEIVAMQALLFGRDDLTVFGDAAARAATLHYLECISGIGAGLGASVLVFGSPRNRRTHDRPPSEVSAIAEEFFRAIGDSAASLGTSLCIEPNPPQYGCDFVNTSAQAMDLIERVGSAGFGLHLDAAAMTMAGEEITAALPIAISGARHFHASEPELAPVGAGNVDHALFASILRDNGYAGWVSVEMRPTSETSNRDVIARAVETAVRAYGNLS